MWTFLHVTVSRVRAVFRSADLDRDFDRELATHLAMAEDDKIRQGMTLEQARREARVELGGLTQLREASRAARGLPWLGGFWLDVKLGLRMLRKSWGLTLVGGLAMTCVIGVGALVFAFFDTLVWGTLPLEDGDRVVAIQTWDAAAHRRHDTSLRDFERWRDELRTVEDVGAFQTIERNLVAANGAVEPVFIAEMTASGFQLARVRPLLGRSLVEEDERVGANPVVVIGYQVWQSRFASDPAVLGQTVRFGSMVHTVVGVMPKDFAFPVNHRFWIPLRADPSDDLRHGPEGVVFARLAPGVTLEGAQAELTTIGLLPSAGWGGELRATPPPRRALYVRLCRRHRALGDPHHLVPRHPAPRPPLCERRHPGLCPDGDAAGGVRGTLCPGREPWPHRRAAVRRNARARGGGSGRCARVRSPGPHVGAGRRGNRIWAARARFG